MFFHFDIPIYKPGWNWRSFKDHPAPDDFNPMQLDTDQWLEAARAIGATYAVLVAKHCSGFLTWQSDLYPYGVRQSSWRGGRGDIVRDFVASCERYGIKPGIYASVTANGFCGAAGGKVQPDGPMTQPEYARSQERMLEELWTRYGPWFYIRFDGGAASPEQGGPDLVPIFKEHQPHANVFQGPVATTRWVGNERGVAGYPCWATVPQLNDSGSGSPEGTVWQPGECDVPIRDHNWFWREGEDDKIHSLDALVDMYHRSVGHNCNLLLNANPDLRGLIPDADMRRYRELGRAIHRLYGKPEARTSGVGELQVLELPQPMAIARLSIMEDIRYGERIREFEVELRTGGDTWRTVATGSAVGHKRLLTFDPVTTPLVRLRVLRADGIPVLRDFAAYAVS